MYNFSGAIGFSVIVLLMFGPTGRLLALFFLRESTKESQLCYPCICDLLRSDMYDSYNCQQMIQYIGSINDPLAFFCNINSHQNCTAHPQMTPNLIKSIDYACKTITSPLLSIPMRKI
ncbi:hypothetical protein PROFUN_12872 [Planoprotostelium fungivorum]|uniref:Uncharacterized protein n=1 Tax=Planoprotostelium fungivorum TaxID=1890364 RepID=A0A2P6N6C4_9EUKA|nr:hypothetical protein PROFUN_12872 [Planoprotostelium fungivorum]